MNSDKLRSFEDAFATGGSGCMRVCNCGRVFYDNYNSGWDWNQGEIDALEADPDATALDYSVGSVEFEGTEYAMDCDCWHERAEKIIGFIDGHAHAIAKYLTLEKQRKVAEAQSSPVVAEAAGKDGE